MPLSLLLPLSLLILLPSITHANYSDQSYQIATSYDRSSEQQALITAVSVSTYNSLGLKHFKRDDVFINAKLIPPWENCRNTSDSNTCMLFSPYVDRVSFSYTHEEDRSSEYTFSEPSVKSMYSLSSPEIHNFDLMDDQRFIFTVMFNCKAQKRAQNDTDVLEVVIPILDNFEITIQFAKTCSCGVHPFVTLGVVNGQQRRLVSPSSGRIVVPPTIETTGIFVRLSVPATSLEVMQPTIRSSDSHISAQIRGVNGYGSVVVGNDLQFSIVYICESNGEANITLSIPIPPWDDMVVPLTKMCGGSAPSMITIGTQPGSGDVIRDGEATADYKMSNIFTMGAHGGKVLGLNVSHLNLYISNEDSYGKPGVQLGKMLITVSQPQVMVAQMKSGAGAENMVVAAGDSRKISIEFICLGRGSVTVLMSIPVLQYKVIEFGMEKECRQPISYKDGIGWQSLWTVEGIEDAIVVSVGLLLLSCYLRLRCCRREHGYQPPAM